MSRQSNQKEDSSIQASLAPVVPRVFSHRSGGVVPLADEIEFLLERGQIVYVQVEGVGKTTALGHLAVVLARHIASGQLSLEDELLPGYGNQSIVTIRSEFEAASDFVLCLAPWGSDDFIEYLLSEHPRECGSVMQRLKNSSADEHFASGSPTVWRLILDRMANDTALSNVEAIVLNELHTRINNPGLADAIADCLIFPANRGEVGVFGHRGNGEPGELPELYGRVHALVQYYLADTDVRNAFAMQRFINRLSAGDLQQTSLLLSGQLDWSQFTQLRHNILGHANIESKLLAVFALNRPRTTANSATLLAVCKPGWCPSGRRLKLSHADFRNVRWPEIDLAGAYLRQACFAGANLTGAIFADAQLSTADFSGANLRSARFSPIRTTSQRTEKPNEPSATNSLIDRIKQQLSRSRKKPTPKDRPSTPRSIFSRTCFLQSNMTDADLSGCRFRNADFREANLEKANLQMAEFVRSSFADANLSHANFSQSNFNAVDLRGANIDDCKFHKLRGTDGLNFEDFRAERVDFSHAKLVGSTWTESTFLNCNFSGSDLTNGRMALIEWENCDLRGADLRGCTFHMGSTRCGLVGSPYPSHGTRTGFYTDDYYDQYFKTPEMIRKASLVNADLRGANIANVDFYLVDLRGARFDAQQRRQLVSTGAILDDGV